MRWSSTISIPRSGPRPDLLPPGPGRRADTHEGCCGSFRIVVGRSCRDVASSGLRREYRWAEHLFQRYGAGVAAAMTADPFPHAVHTSSREFGVAFAGLAVVQRQVVPAAATGRGFRWRAGSPPRPESAAQPADRDKAGADREAQWIHRRSLRIRMGTGESEENSARGRRRAVVATPDPSRWAVV